MTPNPLITKSIEKLDYRVTVGDVAGETGLQLQEVQQGLVGLAAEAGGHLQVSETGDITYLFPKNFRTILRSKYLRLRLQEWWDKVSGVIFYLIRISFGIILVASIILMVIAIFVIIIAAKTSSDEGNSDNRIGGGGGLSINFFPFWLGSDLFWFFSPNYYHRDEPIRRERSRRNSREQNELSFLEAIFSFLFGDGNPNRKLEERRWQEIGRVIQNNNGAVVGEQIAPYLDNISEKSWEDEDYMLPVLMQFNGVPEVTEDGSIIYYFPDLQVKADRQRKQSVESYLKENYWQFTKASSNQKILAIGLGGLNFILALMLGSLLTEEVVIQLGGLIAFVDAIYGILIGYAIGYLVIPLIRYFWIQQQNKKIAARNEKRSQRAEEFLKLAASDQTFQGKLKQAQKFASETILSEEDVAYSTEEDLTEQEAKQSDKIDEEWKRRLGL
ncbi:hypothetical protein FRE64_13885 [Euhalothece natronophila Z-M001]|uniref:Uncharacterized protein n=1 Tax=Euhalothece natronophila Z-M001 TaxID=522448 RepID=A0A5B8NPI6_9CHRO|nr:hypothetical protein [Euhalothece natronophila]QDZ40934.1 hypothetical protein FRE64_13885 [Euhalothece natronophila Z-M001]